MKIFDRGLIVSCQALEGNPLRDTETLTKMAMAAELGGACAIRANGYDDISSIKKNVKIPVLGINKLKDTTGRTIITPTFESAKIIADAGADIIALDVTFEKSDIKEDTEKLIYRIRNELKLPVMADISTEEEAVFAEKCGVDCVSTTLAGYLPSAPFPSDELYVPNLKLVENIVKKINIPVIAEGRYWHPADLQAALDLGAYGIVVGKAITNPIAITKYMLSGLNFK